MSYTKTNWVNGGPPARNATNLNKQEEGIRTAHVTADDAAARTLDGISWPAGGDIDLVAGSNVTLTGNNTTKQITIQAAGGGSSTGMTTVDTVTGLQTLSGTSVGDKRLVLGYSAINDGGGGVVRDTNSGTTVDGGDVISHNSGGSRRWERIYIGETYRNVMKFGAQPTFSFNSGPAIQTALNKRGTVVFPDGDFRTDALLDIGSRTQIRGNGWRTILRGYSTADPVVRATGNGDPEEPDGLIGCSIENISIEGQDTRTGVFWGHQPNPPTDPTYPRSNWIRNVYFNHCSIGLQLVFDQGIHIQDCWFRRNDIGLRATDQSELALVSQCDFRQNRDYGTYMDSRDDYLELGFNPDLVYGWQFDRCHWESNDAVGILMRAVHSTTFNACKWEANGGHQVVLENDDLGRRCEQVVFVNGIWIDHNAVLHVSISGALGTQFIGGEMVADGTTGVQINSGSWYTRFDNVNLFGALPFVDNGLDTRVDTPNRYYANPTITPGSGMGTGASTSNTQNFMNASIKGRLTLNTGTSPATNATVATWAFGVTMPVAPKLVRLSPANVAAANLGPTLYVDSTTLSTTGFTIKNGSTALAASSTYIFYYEIVM